MKLRILPSIIIACLCVSASHAIEAGDVAIVGYNTSGTPDSFAILVLKDLPAGTVFYINDNEIASDGGTSFTDLAEMEASFTVKPNQTIAAGTVITLPWGAAAVDTAAYNYSSTSGAGLGNNNDEIYIYTASAITSTTPTAFIYAAKIGNSTSSRPSGLTNGTTFIAPTGAAARYKTTGATYSGTAAELLSAIGNTASNWEASAPGTWTFTVGAAATTMTLGVSPNSFSESASNPAATGTVTLSASSASPVVVSLSSSDTSEATVPATVTIPANQTSATFDVTAVDDTLVDGNQTVTLTASATGVASATSVITVQDDGDLPPPANVLTVSVSPSTFSESAASAATGTVTRSVSSASPLVVTLSSSDTSEATVPTTVTILANETSATFSVTPVNDVIPDGNQTVTITATATDATSGTTNVTVQDDGDVFMSKGHLAFTAFNADEDGFAMVALKEIPANSIVYFTDNEWSGTAFNTGEGYLSWNTGASAIAAGTVIRFSSIDTTSLAASVGTLARVAVANNTNWGFSASEDSMYAYQADTVTGTPVFLAAICNKSFGTSTAGYLTNTGLSLGDGAVESGYSGGSDFMEYTAARNDQATFDAYLSKVSTFSGNWTDGADGVFATTVPNTTAFTLKPVVTSVDLSKYVRVGRYGLPEPIRTPLPANTPVGNLLCQEASGVTYNWDTDTLFIVGDGGKSVTQVSKTGALIDTMTLAAGNSPQGTEFYDTEGITYIGNGQFVMSEERDRKLVKFTYAAGTTLTRADAQTVQIGTFIGNVGTEGLSYDPYSSGFICVKEISPIGLFQTGVDFTAGTATNGSATTTNSTNLFDPALLGMSDTADVFALSNLPSLSGKAQEGNLLVLSQENGRVVNVDRSGTVSSTLNIAAVVGDTLSVADMQHEGLTMDRDGVLYIVNENGGGDIDHPELWVYAPSSLPNQAATAVTLSNSTSSIDENTSTQSPIKVADLIVTDDGLGTNVLSISGADAASFVITGSSLYLKAGVVLDYETQTSYSITISADDATVGSTPDATVNYTLAVGNIEPEAVTGPALVITEVAPWSSSNSGTDLAVDWFEVTNVSNAAVSISGWKVDDSSALFANAAALTGVTSIAPGESVIFMETSDLVTKSAAFKSLWFGSNVPAGLQIGSYSGSGLGLSSAGDGVVLFDANGVKKAAVSFGASPTGPTFSTFENGAGLNDQAISQLSQSGIYGAAAASADANQVGSPGSIGKLFVSEIAPWSSGNSPVQADWFELTNKSARTWDLTGWKMDDNSQSPVGAVALNGVSSIAPGESVIFIESATPVSAVAAFKSNWFGSNVPAGLQIGTYTGSGVGLGSGGDAVNVYDSANTLRASVSFGASPTTAPFTTFDNTAGLNGVAITTFSATSINQAFVAANNSSEIGSPGVCVIQSGVTFASWLSANGFTSSNIDGDSDNDGLKDRAEFYFNSNPNSSANGSNLPAVVKNGANLELRFSRTNNLAGVTGVLVCSTTLEGTWSRAVEGVDYEVVTETTQGAQTNVVYRLLGTATAKFFRFEIQ